MLYKVLLTFESVDEILKCDHSNETELLSNTFPLVLSNGNLRKNIYLLSTLPAYQEVQ